MTPDSIPHLCGGLFFALLLEAKKPRRKAKNKLKGGTDGLNNPDVYAGLINVVLGEGFYGNSTLKKAASNYKNCKESKGSYVPFTEPSTISAFHSAVTKKDPNILKRMSGFVEQYLNTTKCCEWLVPALIELMQKDENINQAQLIAIDTTESRRINELHLAECIQLQPFLISVLDLVMQYSPDAESGRSTFETLYFQSGNKNEWKYREDNILGKSLPPIKIISVPFSGTTATEETTPQSVEPISDDFPTDFIPTEEKSDDDILMEPMIAGLTTFATAVEALKHQQADAIRKNKQRHIDEGLLDQFKNDCDTTLRYCIDKDPASEPIRTTINDEITDIVQKWQFELRKISDDEMRGLVVATIKTLSAYTLYLSDKYLRFNEDNSMLIFRNSSTEEGERLREDFRPNSLHLRKNLNTLYKKLWPAPEIDVDDDSVSSDTPENTADNVENAAEAKVVQQTIVNQYGDNPVIINHVNKLKL